MEEKKSNIEKEGKKPLFITLIRVSNFSKKCLEHFFNDCVGLATFLVMEVGAVPLIFEC